MRPQPLETNLLTIARFAAVRQLTFHTLLTLLIPLRPSAKEHCSTLPAASGIVWHRHSCLCSLAHCQLLHCSSQHNRCLSSRRGQFKLIKDHFGGLSTLQKLKVPEYCPAGCVLGLIGGFSLRWAGVPKDSIFTLPHCCRTCSFPPGFMPRLLLRYLLYQSPPLCASAPAHNS